MIREDCIAWEPQKHISVYTNEGDAFMDSINFFHYTRVATCASKERSTTRRITVARGMHSLFRLCYPRKIKSLVSEVLINLVMQKKNVWAGVMMK